MARSKTYEEVKTFIEDNGCKLLSTEYINNYTPLLIRCACGNEFTTIFSTFSYKRKRQCNECARKSKNWDYSFDEVKAIIENNNCKLLSDIYINSTVDLDLICNCGNHFSTNFYKFLKFNKRQCDECSNKIKGEKGRHTYEDVKQFVENDSESGCTLINKEYKGTNSKLEIKCHCGNYFHVSFHTFKDNGQRQCKKCNKAISQGESAIKEYLDNNRIKYKSQYKFKDCKYKNCLPFDFAVLNKDKSVKFAIEFQGKQHYEPVGCWGGLEGLMYQQIRDEIKRNYCKNNKINLIIIPYWEFKNINIILEKELKKEEF